MAEELRMESIKCTYNFGLLKGWPIELLWESKYESYRLDSLIGESMDKFTIIERILKSRELEELREVKIKK